LAVAAPATGSVILSDNFNSENGGSGAPAYSGFANFTSGGSVDLIKSGDFGIICDGLCVELDSGDGYGGYFRSNSYSFEAGDTIRVNFDVGGNQVDDQDFDFWSAGFQFDQTTVLTNIGTNFYGVDVNYGPDTIFYATQFGDVIGSALPMGRRSVFFTASQAGIFAFVTDAQSYNGTGPIIDNIEISRTGVAAVPEPAEWSLMILGFGMVGTMARRGRQASHI
jgi:hypothetical protein